MTITNSSRDVLHRFAEALKKSYTRFHITSSKDGVIYGTDGFGVHHKIEMKNGHVHHTEINPHGEGKPSKLHKYQLAGVLKNQKYQEQADFHHAEKEKHLQSSMKFAKRAKHVEVPHHNAYVAHDTAARHYEGLADGSSTDVKEANDAAGRAMESSAIAKRAEKSHVSEKEGGRSVGHAVETKSNPTVSKLHTKAHQHFYKAAKFHIAGNHDQGDQHDQLGHEFRKKAKAVG